ncbi:hypothetical protein D9M68_463710 [compost metagenome]
MLDTAWTFGENCRPTLPSLSLSIMSMHAETLSANGSPEGGICRPCRDSLRNEAWSWRLTRCLISPPVPIGESIPTSLDSGWAESSWAMMPRSGLDPVGCLSYQRTWLPVSSERLAIVAWSGRPACLVSNTSTILGPTPCRVVSWSPLPNRLVHQVANPSLHASVVPPALDTTRLTIGLAARRSVTSSSARETWAGLNPLDIPPTVSPKLLSNGARRARSGICPSREPFQSTDQ